MAYQNPDQFQMTHDWLVLYCIKKMLDAEAEGNMGSYFAYFRGGLQLMIAYMNTDEKIEVEANYKLLKNEIKELESREGNEATKFQKVNKIKADFAGFYRIHIFNLMSRTGIVKKEDDGVIDFGKHDFKVLSTVINSLNVKTKISVLEERLKGIDKEDKEEIVIDEDKGEGLNGVEVPKNADSESATTESVG